MKATAQDH